MLLSKHCNLEVTLNEEVDLIWLGIGADLIPLL